MSHISAVRGSGSIFKRMGFVLGLGIAVCSLSVTGNGAVVASASTTKPHLTIGVTTDHGPWITTELDAWQRDSGVQPTIVEYYRGFSDPWEQALALRISLRGATPLITWAPVLTGAGSSAARPYELRSIAAGAFDSYIRNWALGAKSFGRPVMLRFGHEMNGGWYPWGLGQNGNTARDYVLAWRHIHEIFSQVGARNVSWIWSPNVVDQTTSSALAALYPGDAYVDWVGLDGYNFGGSKGWNGWQSPSAVFGPSILAVQAVSKKPMIISETASVESGAAKAQWITQLFDFISQHPEIRALVWFDHSGNPDWRISSSPSATKAFAAGAARFAN